MLYDEETKIQRGQVGVVLSSALGLGKVRGGTGASLALSQSPASWADKLCRENLGGTGLGTLDQPRAVSIPAPWIF